MPSFHDPVPSSYGRIGPSHMTPLPLSLGESMTLAAKAIALLEHSAVLAGQGSRFASFEARLLLLRCRLRAGEASHGLTLEVRDYVAELERFVSSRWGS